MLCVCVCVCVCVLGRLATSGVAVEHARVQSSVHVDTLSDCELTLLMILIVFDAGIMSRACAASTYHVCLETIEANLYMWVIKP